MNYYKLNWILLTNIKIEWQKYYCRCITKNKLKKNKGTIMC